MKWRVLAVEDGNGGAVLAWEENRGRKVCCRDTRDIYAQRLDVAGASKWGIGDVRVAAEEAGEELLGMLPEGEGGAFLLWHRSGDLVIDFLDGSGIGRYGNGGKVIHSSPASTEWNPLNGFDRSPSADRGLVAWTEQEPDAEAGVHVLPLDRREGAWTAGNPGIAVGGKDLHGAAVAACAGKRWFLCYWSNSGSGAELRGLWLSQGGSAIGRPFRIARDDTKRFMHAEAFGDGAGAAFVAWASADPDALGRSHNLHVAHVRRTKGGRTDVEDSAAGEARTMALHITPTLIHVEGSGEVPATPDFVAWRRTSSFVPTAPGAGLVGAIDGEGLNVRFVGCRGRRIVVSEPVPAARPANGGLAPVWVPAGDGRWLLLWGEKRERGVIMGRLVRVTGSAPVLEGEPFDVAGEATGGPRLEASVALSGGGAVLAWAAVRPSDSGLVRAQKIFLREGAK